MAPPKNPKNRWSDKEWRDAIRLAVNEKGDGGEKKLRLLARKLVDNGIAGDVSAIREVGDRLDGKPRQEIEASITDERMVVRAPDQPADASDWRSKHGPH